MSHPELVRFIQAASAAVVGQAGKELPGDFSFQVIPTKTRDHGDLATNAAFKLATVLGADTRGCADKLVIVLQSTGGYATLVERQEIAGPGFVNFFLKKGAAFGVLKEAFEQGPEFGRSKALASERALFEFVSANPTGPLTVAHGRQAVLGDALAGLWAWAGAKVEREYYVNDMGRQSRLLAESLWARYQELMGESVPFPEEGYHGDYLKALAEDVRREKGDAYRGRKDAEALAYFTQFAQNTILDGIRRDLERARVKFDRYFHESTLHQGAVDQALGALRAQGHLYDQDGAVWFRSTPFGDDKDRVVRKSTGELTYLAPDLTYHDQKFKRGYTRLVNLWGPDHHGYVPRLKASCAALGHPADRLTVLIVQLVTLSRRGQPVRMSTRAGEFVTLAELLEEVGVDATRFFYLLRRLESHLDFDLELAKEKSQDNPVYYLQYAHARICSILRKSPVAAASEVELERLGNEEELALAKLLVQFPETIVRAARQFEPYPVVDYLREVAAKFHQFYSLHRVVSDDQPLMMARLLVCKATQTVLANGLSLLGVSAPESM